MQVGKSINNSAHIYPSPSQPLSTPRVLVCNNVSNKSHPFQQVIAIPADKRPASDAQDCGIYRYDLHFPKRWGSMELASEWTGGEDPLARPEMDIIDRISLNTPVNHATVSPDGRSMVAVGDTNEVFVFALSSTGHVTLIDTIEGMYIPLRRQAYLIPNYFRPHLLQLPTTRRSLQAGQGRVTLLLSLHKTELSPFSTGGTWSLSSDSTAFNAVQRVQRESSNTLRAQMNCWLSQSRRTTSMW